MTAATDPTDDEILARLGIQPAEPFDWGNELPLIMDSINTQSVVPLSGLDSLMKYVGGTNDDGHDNVARERQILQTLFRGANIDLSTQNDSSSSKMEKPDVNDDLKNALPDEMMDVSIKGLSDRAVAELNVESRTSLFGSILRLFDAPRSEEIISGESNKEKNKGNGDQGVDKEGTTDTDMDVDVTSTSLASALAPTIAKGIESMIMKDPILSTPEIVRTVHLAARPGDIPAGFDSKEYTMVVLRFLSSDIPYLHEDETEYRSKEDRSSQEGWDQLRMTLPILPLLKVTNPEASVEQRCYGRVRPLVKLGQNERAQYPDSMDRDNEFRKKVLNLELIFASSLPFSSPCMHARLSSKLASKSAPCPTSSSSQPTESATTLATPTEATTDQKTSDNDLRFAFQRFVPRRRLVPNIEGGAKEELTLMISGHMQQPENTPGPKPRLTKSRREALLDGKGVAAAPSPANTAVHSKSDKVLVKGAASPKLTPSKRKQDTPTNNPISPTKG